jgi:hypothetical protein
MKTINLQQFVRLRRELSEERESLQARLHQISEALGEMPLSSLSPIQGATSTAPSQPARRGRRTAGGGQSLRDHVIAVLQSGPMSKEEILKAVQGRGYTFSTKNPLNSLGVILYGKNPKLKRADGKFSLGKGSAGGTATTARDTGRTGKRTMSPAGRARIAAAQRARWAKQRGGTVAVEAPSNGATAKPKRKMSAAGRKAIADAARRRWAAAKAAGKKGL